VRQAGADPRPPHRGLPPTGARLLPRPRRGRSGRRGTGRGDPRSVAGEAPDGQGGRGPVPRPRRGAGGRGAVRPRASGAGGTRRGRGARPPLRVDPRRGGRGLLAPPRAVGPRARLLEGRGQAADPPGRSSARRGARDRSRCGASRGGPPRSGAPGRPAPVRPAPLIPGAVDGLPPGATMRLRDPPSEVSSAWVSLAP